jgi:hypothetical protein
MIPFLFNLSFQSCPSSELHCTARFMFCHLRFQHLLSKFRRAHVWMVGNMVQKTDADRRGIQTRIPSWDGPRSRKAAPLVWFKAQIKWWLSCRYSRFSNPAAVVDWISSRSGTRLDHENIRHLDATFMGCSKAPLVVYLH